jgi:ribosomal protein L11 methyltransferase
LSSVSNAPRRPPVPPLFELVLRTPPAHADSAVEWLVGRGAPGLEERAIDGASEIVLYGEERKALLGLAASARRELSRAFPISTEVRVAEMARAAWRSSWAEHLVPHRLTRDLIAVPTTSEARRLPRALRAIFLEPALAFGYGEHATTRLAARAVEQSCRARKAQRVLDVGTGSGVLALVAVLSGAQRAVGLDVDSAAIKAARRNASRNGLTARCRFSTTPVAKVRRAFDLVVANIRLGPLVELAPALARVVRPGAELVLAGILVEERRELELRYLELGFRRVSRRIPRSEEGWALVVLRRVP